MTLKERADVVEQLRDLHQQATHERSHFYVGSVVRSAIHEILTLRERLAGATDKEALREAFRAGGNLLRPNPSDIGESEPVTDYIERKLAAYLAKKGEGG